MEIIRSFILEQKLWIILSVGIIYNFCWLYECRKRLEFRQSTIWLISVLHTVVGVMFVKFFALLEAGFNSEIAGNMSLYGGIFFMPAFYLVLIKVTGKNSADIFDIFTICMIFTLLCARMNCIFSGCCMGKCIVEGGTFKWPTRELEILYYVVLIFVLKRKIFKQGTRGTLYPIYMISYGVFRFVIEWFREADSNFIYVFHKAHIWSLISICVGLIIYRHLKQTKHIRK